MKIGLNSGIFPSSMSPAEKVEATVRVGATGLEINIDANQLWTQLLDQKDRKILAQRASDAGVSITSLCMNAHWIFNLTSPDVRIRNVGVSLLLDAIAMAEELGAGAILVPGCDQDQSPENKWDLFRNSLLQAIGCAQRTGVKLALEAVGKPFLFDTAKLLKMIHDCGDTDVLGIYLDVGNSTSGDMDAASEIRAAQGRAILTHVKDWNPENRNERELGAGAVDFRSSLAALRDIGYDQHLLVELPPKAGDPDLVARESVEFLREILHE